MMDWRTIPNYSHLLEEFEKNELKAKQLDPPMPPQEILAFEGTSSLTKRRDTYPFIDPHRFRNTLREKVVIVTLAHRGIGRAAAVDFARAGASVCCIGPSAQALQPVLQEIKEKFNTPTLALTADLTEAEAPKSIIQLVEKHLGPVDILINVTASSFIRPFTMEPDIMQDWWPSFEQTVKAPIALIQAVLPSMISRGAGIIISTANASGIAAVPFLSCSGSANAALIKFHTHLNLEVRNKGILSFAVNPGPIPSHIHDPDLLFEMDPEVAVKEPELQAVVVELASQVSWASVGLPSGTFLTLCAEPRAEILSGLYVNAERDLEELIQGVERNRGKVKAQKLYVIKVDEL